MCIRVQYAPLSSLIPWDPSQRLITLPKDLPAESSTDVIRALLAELAVPQPLFGAVCFCGAPVDLLPRIPEQRRSSQVIHHGA